MLVCNWLWRAPDPQFQLHQFSWFGVFLSANENIKMPIAFECTSLENLAIDVSIVDSSSQLFKYKFSKKNLLTHRFLYLAWKYAATKFFFREILCYIISERAAGAFVISEKQIASNGKKRIYYPIFSEWGTDSTKIKTKR